MFCKDWRLDVNLCKTKILIFNKTGKLSKDEFSFDNAPLECVQHYRYLGVTFQLVECLILPRTIFSNNLQKLQLDLQNIRAQF